MNWTEGNLNRHSRARKGKETLLRQKEHFAKVRAGLLDANVKISPPSVSFLALPARPPSSVRRAAPESAPTTRYQGDDRLVSSRYFPESHPKSPAPTRLREQEAEDEVLRQKRRKLLLRGDWVGTNVQKPIEMDFTKPRGSPSNPWAVKKSRHQASKRKLRRLLGVAHGGGQNRTRLGAVDTSTPISLRRIKVRVGSYERALHDSSNASPRSNSLLVGFSGSHGQPKHRNRGQHFQERDQVCVSPSGASRHSHSSASQTPLLSTSPLLFHPVPTRPALLQLLHRPSFDSDNADSTLAQLGVERPPVPLSQADENDVWRTFVEGHDEASPLEDMGSHDALEDATQRQVSPGASQLGTPRQLQGGFSSDASVSTEPQEVNNVDQGETATAPASLPAEEERSDLSRQRSSKNFSGDNQIAPTADDYSPSCVDSDLPQPPESPGNKHRQYEGSIKEQNTTAQSSDKVSLLGASSSPKLPPSLDTVDEATPFQIDQPGDSAITLNTLSMVTVPKLHGKDASTRNGEPASVEIQVPSESTQDYENDMWKNFVFGACSENLETALEEARRDTARNLRPSLTPTSTYSSSECQQVFTTSPFGLQSIDRCDFAEALYGSTGDVVATASVSHIATAGASSADLSSETASGSVATATRTDQATHGSLSSSATAGQNTSGLLFPDDSITSSVCEEGTITSIIDPKQLEKDGEVDDCFKFARPKLFVGKKIEHVDEQRQIALSAPQIRGTTQTRRKRRMTDGRANIRRLPNYGSSDPIEEFDGDFRSDRAEKGSMFGSLETENGV